MIEAKIDALIAALNANTEALLSRGQTTLPLTTDKSEKKKTEKVAAPAPASKPESAPVAVAAEITVEQFQAVGHAIIDARHAKKLEPANAPIKALATEYGVKKISEVAGTEKAAEVYAKLQAVLKEVSS